MNSLLAGAVGRRMAAALLPQSDQQPPQPVTLQTFPFFHIGGMTGLYVSTAVGAKLVLMYRWDAAHAAELVEKHRIVSASGVPIVVRQLLQAASETGRDLSSLQGIASGGAPVPPDLIRRIGKDFEAKVAPGNGYGLTETTSAVITNSGADYLARPDSVGRPVVTADVRVVDDNGRDCSGGDIGEIWIRGANVIPGYWNNPDATAAAFTDGWFHTGDLGYRDAEGFYHVVDRKKDMIIRGGENIYCAEVEAALLEHPGVRDAAVVGVPDAAYGEQVGAIIQRARNWEPRDLETALSGFLAERLARFKIPTRYHFIDQDLPRTATGKVLKRELRQDYFK
jgi:acyl-CoA synthetase (AMP-forming)/AMP-acid ligase II